MFTFNILFFGDLFTAAWADLDAGFGGLFCFFGLIARRFFLVWEIVVFAAKQLAAQVKGLVREGVPFIHNTSHPGHASF